MVTHWFCVHCCSGLRIYEIHVQVKSSKRFFVGQNSSSGEVDIAHAYVVMMRHMLSSVSKEDLRNRPYRSGKYSTPFKLTSLMFSVMYKVICHGSGASLTGGDSPISISQNCVNRVGFHHNHPAPSLDDHKTGKRRIFLEFTINNIDMQPVIAIWLNYKTQDNFA